MTAIRSITRTKIKAYLEVFIDNLVNSYRNRGIPRIPPSQYLSQTSTKGQLKPFHAAIFSPELLRINEFERGFSSGLGTTYEECARLIAADHHKEAHRSYELKDNVSLAAIHEINHQVSRFEQSAYIHEMKPSFEKMIYSVLQSQKLTDLVPRIAKVDLYILSHEGEHIFFEIKGSKPNKGQCLEVFERLLRFHLLSVNKQPSRTYYAMAYNPYGANRVDYKWSVAKQYTPFEDAVVIGHEFWEIVGGETAYAELLEIYQEVGYEKSKYMLDALAFGF
ncbi:TdeIII family type II restriction endonuclease [Oscillatoria sp. FACHB-1406]|uniref:TdeIII family type II restriction endonuclease n=1 Tax=Oscillatoria sp. FACHB-1406 TaxID=2692846 RepID=UPI001681FCCD|nr:TdeIII family type II restriction endonuclease [Oscillatoria sp. FACHB-1406]MBD2578522.1 TdeIII family type II restriction endonuclease [Oscillatoria sp. FACHB-1406]